MKLIYESVIYITTVGFFLCICIWCTQMYVDQMLASDVPQSLSTFLCFLLLLMLFLFSFETRSLTKPRAYNFGWWTARETQGSACLNISSAGVIDMYHYDTWFLENQHSPWRVDPLSHILSPIVDFHTINKVLITWPLVFPSSFLWKAWCLLTPKGIS